MLRHLVRLTVVSMLLFGATSAIARFTGAPKGVTGAPAIGNVPAEPTCLHCHDDANGLNDGSGSIEILDLPAQFELNTDYALRVRLTHAWDPLPDDPPNWGFQITAVRADSGTGYGTFTPGIGTKIQTGTPVSGTNATRQYVTHDASGTHSGSAGPVEWTMTWRSPAYEAGQVLFHAAGNSADGSFTSSGDWIFTTYASMTLQILDVGDHLITTTELARPAPNPTSGPCEIRFSLGLASQVDLAVFDAQGRRVRTLIRGWQEPGPGSARWDGRNDLGHPARAGVYFARLSTLKETTPLVRKIILSR